MLYYYQFEKWKKLSLVKFLTVNSVFYSADKKVIVYESLTVSYDSYISRIIKEKLLLRQIPNN